ncbi:MAG: PEP/pyruvate-binding domain-containing protein [Lentisphaerae bacterium]|nr:PEP/pyruvate-binding domain-containing protein [Lentisphaerota bacterium]
MNPPDQARGAAGPTTGLPGLDRVMRELQPGDNVVWQVQEIEDYRALVIPYANAARAAGAHLIYFRFAPQQPLLPDNVGAEVHTLNPEVGFEAFVDAVHAVIERAGTGAWYIFDCLSALAEEWHTDQMMGNFFVLTCPRLFDLQTVTYFALYRNRHTVHATRAIRETTQFMLDVFRHRGGLYVRPIKVPHRSRDAMNLIHAWEGDAFVPVTDSATVSDVLADAEWPGLQVESHRGYWRRFFAEARACVAQHKSAAPDSQREAVLFARATSLLFGEEPRVRDLARRNLTLADLLAIWDRQIGVGRIGGKAAGMLLARAILRREKPDLHDQLEAPDAFYVGADVFRSFLVQNGLWWVRRRQHDPAAFLQGLDEARTRMLSGRFADHTVDQFEGMLEYFGEWPYIVRSSSLLEDAYGNAFAGKYDSVFCVNRGSREARLAQLLEAVRRVYASSMSEEALQYRLRRGLLERDEQMALLIMRVSGAAHGRHFFPQAAGVGFSYNPYPWDRRIDPAAGVIRLVLGLGTRAVDRADDDYTRLIALNAPTVRPESTFEDICQHAQRRMDTLDLEAGELASHHVLDVLEQPPGFPLERFATVAPGADGTPRQALTFSGLVEDTPFIAQMREILSTLQLEYANPVEVEFTLNFLRHGHYRINLLQCRTLQLRGVPLVVEGTLKTASASTLLEFGGAVIGVGRDRTIDALVHVVPARYAALPQQSRYEVARVIGRLNRALGRGRPYLLLGPGRWGTRDPALGVPVRFSEINHAAALGEIVAMHHGLVPDASLGAHFLSELVEMDMLYLALDPAKPGNRQDAAWLEGTPNQLPQWLPDDAAWAEVIRVLRPTPNVLRLTADSLTQTAALLLVSAPPQPPET